MKSTERTILALALGLGVGAVLGVLFAPDKGSETRKRIKEGVGDCYSRINSAIDELKETLANKEPQLADSVVDNEEV